MPSVTEHAPFGVSTVWTYKPMRVEVAFQPQGAHAIVQELGDRKVNHAAIILHTSHGGYT